MKQRDRQRRIPGARNDTMIETLKNSVPQNVPQGEDAQRQKLANYINGRLEKRGGNTPQMMPDLAVL